jgi:aminoglycoside 3-N-acetyltransferase I
LRGLTTRSMRQLEIARILQPADISALRSMLALFGEVFEDQETYLGKQPDDDYLRNLLSNVNFVAVAAFADSVVIGGVAAYVLPKFEQARSEIYIYDLAVKVDHRRKGVATAMIEELKRFAVQRSAQVIFVQADYGDDAAVSLYSKLEAREDVMHFDFLRPQVPASAVAPNPLLRATRCPWRCRVH